MSDVITVPSHTKKDNPKAALKTPSAPSVTQPGPYILIPSDRRQLGIVVTSADLWQAIWRALAMK
jgi:hypothetical protein